jgi:ketosteroid isomerase-like protein
LSTETATAATTDVETIVRDWLRFYSEKNFEAHNALIHPDAVVMYPEMNFVDPDLTAGRDFLLKTLEKDEKAFIDLQMRVDNLWVIGDTAFVEGFFVGTKVGSTIGDAASGSDMRLRFLNRIEIQDGMVKLVYCFYDTALLYQIQLGLEGPTRENPIPPWMIALAAAD